MKDSVNKNRIEKTALELFRKFGIKSVTVNDITSTLAISKKTFYKHFNSKEELLEQLIDDTIHGFKQNVLILKLKHKGLDQFLWISYYHMFWLRTFSQVMIFDIKKYYPDLTQRYNSFRDLFITDRLVELIREAKVKGQVRTGVDEHLFCKVQLNLVESLMDNKLHFMMEQNQDSLFEHLVLNNLKGIITNSYEIQFELENFRLDLKEAS